jgi:hypothetical protein
VCVCVCVCVCVNGVCVCVCDHVLFSTAVLALARSPVRSQTYYVNGVVQHGAPNYFGGLLTVGSQVIPVCFFFQPHGTFVFMVDGRGSCPPAPAAATCYSGPQPGTVIQIWAGTFSGADEARSSLVSGSRSVFFFFFLSPFPSGACRCFRTGLCSYPAEAPSGVNQRGVSLPLVLLCVPPLPSALFCLAPPSCATTRH